MKNTLKDWANAFNAYVAFPKRWPDEDKASYLHVFIGKPIMGEDGDWKEDENGNGMLINSLYVGDSMTEEILKISPEESLTEPDKLCDSIWEYSNSYYNSKPLSFQTIANLMNMYLVKLNDGSLFLFKREPILVSCFYGAEPPLPDVAYEAFNYEDDYYYDKAMWEESRIRNHITKTKIYQNWFAGGYSSPVPRQFKIDWEDYDRKSFRDVLIRPEI